MLRRLHETTADHPLAAGRECVVHGDPGPFNTIFRQGLPVAFIDWASCRPGDRLGDLGYMLWTWCIQSQGHVPVAEQARHLRKLRDGYGDIEPEILLDAMVRSQTAVGASLTLAHASPMVRLKITHISCMIELVRVVTLARRSPSFASNTVSLASARSPSRRIGELSVLQALSRSVTSA